MSLFAHLALRLSASPENVAIEALGFLLAGSPAARAAFLRQIGGDAAPADLHFDTQARSDDVARPDLEARDADGRPAIVVECKFHAGLTEHQPVTYAARLADERAGTLVFVVPAMRLVPLWSELARRMGAADLPLGPRVETGPEAWSARFGTHRRLVLLSWRATLATMRHAMEDAGEVEHLGDLRQLAGLCESMDTQAFLPLRSEELTGTGVARRYAEFGQLAYDAGEALIGAGVCDARGLTAAGGLGYYGRYLRHRDCVFFLGFDSLAWAAHGHSPIWLRFDQYAPAAVRALLRRTKTTGEGIPVIAEPKGRSLVPLHIEPGQERPALVAALCNQTTAVLGELLARLGAAPAGPVMLADPAAAPTV